MNIMHSVSSVKPLSIAKLPIVPSTFSCTFGCYPNNTHLGSARSSLYRITSSSLLPCAAIGLKTPSDEETVSSVILEDLVEKDWSFLDNVETSNDKIDRIISAGEIVKTSKVLVSIGSESFVDRMVSSSPCEQLLVVHESLFVLACIKEMYDKVNCWQGDLISIPESWTGFDVMYLYFLPGLNFELDQLLPALANRCLPGTRIVISHPQGRLMVEEQRRQYADVVVSDLPEKIKLQSVAAEHSFEVVEFVDEPGIYLAVLRCNVA